MKVKDNYLLKKVADSNIVIPLGGDNVDFNTVITLNGTAAFLWEHLKTETTREALVEALFAEYEVTKEKAEADVDAFLAKVAKAGLLA